MPVAPMSAVEPLCVDELLHVVVPDDTSEVAVNVWRLAVPDVWVRLPPTVTVLGVPIDVSELLTTPDPSVVEFSV